MTPAAEATTEGKSCWICLEGGADDSGRPLTRNCACRGDSGWAHVACLAGFAKARTDDMTVHDYAECIVGKEGTPWSVCQTCTQCFHGDLATALAREWMDAVADLDVASPQRIAAKINLVGNLLMNKSYAMVINTCEEIREIMKSNAHNMDESFVAGGEMVCLLALMAASWQSRNTEQTLNYIAQFKSSKEKMGMVSPCDTKILSSMIEESRIAGLNGKGGLKTEIEPFTSLHNKEVKMNGKYSPKAIKSSALLAEKHFRAGQLTDLPPRRKEAFDRAKRDIENLFSTIEESMIPGQNGKGGIKNEIEFFTSYHSEQVEMNGKDTPIAIHLSRLIAAKYLKAGQFKDSLLWYNDSHDRAKRLFGASHPEYLAIKSAYLLINATLGPRKGKLMMRDPKLDGKCVTILRAAKNGKKYIVDIGGSDATGSPRKVKVTPSQLVFAPDTRVTMDDRGDSFAAYVDSFDEKTESYKVFAPSGVGNNNQHQFLDVSRKNVHVVFARPPTSQVGK